MKIVDSLTEKHKNIFFAIKSHAETLLDHPTKFQYFTLHGKTHIENMLNIVDIFLELGITLSEIERFYLCIAICIHDLGMVITLKDKTYKEIFGGLPQIPDPTYLDNYIRDLHHELVNEYVEKHFDFLSSLGLSAPDCGIIKDIAKVHRKISFDELRGFQRKIGALLRVVDEFDIGSNRAPIAILREKYKEMDVISCWHWFKHNIVDSWDLNHNIQKITDQDIKTINFQLVVRPPKNNSIRYWTRQILRPILKVLIDEKSASIIFQYWKMNIKVNLYEKLSTPNYIDKKWEKIEEIALSSNRKTILLIDDEVRKMEDLLFPLMEDYHVIFAPDAKDALSKIEAINIDLAIVDLQIGSGNLWKPEETDDYKKTGKKICEEIKRISPKTKILILTGTRYNIDYCENLDIEFLFTKPVDSITFEEKINELLK